MKSGKGFGLTVRRVWSPLQSTSICGTGRGRKVGETVEKVSKEQNPNRDLHPFYQTIGPNLSSTNQPKKSADSAVVRVKQSTLIDRDFHARRDKNKGGGFLRTKAKRETRARGNFNPLALRNAKRGTRGSLFGTECRGAHMFAKVVVFVP